MSACDYVVTLAYFPRFLLMCAKLLHRFELQEVKRKKQENFCFDYDLSMIVLREVETNMTISRSTIY
jgi:hypothetical protein